MLGKGRLTTSIHEEAIFPDLESYKKITTELKIGIWNCDLSETESVGHDAIDGVGVHLRPLELEVVDPGPVLPERAVGVVVELRSIGLACVTNNRQKKNKQTHSFDIYIWCQKWGLKIKTMNKQSRVTE